MTPTAETRSDIYYPNTEMLYIERKAAEEIKYLSDKKGQAIEVVCPLDENGHYTLEKKILEQGCLASERVFDDGSNEQGVIRHFEMKKEDKATVNKLVKTQIFKVKRNEKGQPLEMAVYDSGETSTLFSTAKIDPETGFIQEYTEYFPSGGTKLKTVCDPDKIHEKTTHYYEHQPEAKLKTECVAYDFNHGTTLEYYSNGAVQAKKEFNYGLKDGSWLFFRNVENAQPFATEEYKNGVRQYPKTTGLLMECQENIAGGKTETHPVAPWAFIPS